MKKNLSILITNDDGIQSGGLKALIEAIQPFGDITVVAPDMPMSGMSHAISVNVPLSLTQVSKEAGITIYKSNGTPADCVKMALSILFESKPDFVLSGINHGSNSSTNIHYSGTLGGAREGALSGIPSIGFSLLDYSADADFTTAIKYSRQIFRSFLENGMNPNSLYNINIPNITDIKGIKVSRQAKGRWIEEYDKYISPHGNTHYYLTGKFVNDEPEATDTDEWALNNGYVSLMPCTLDGTCYETIKEFKVLKEET